MNGVNYADYSKLGNYDDLKLKKDRFLYRSFEILPAFLTWFVLLLVIFLSFKTPRAIAIFIILFDVYWLVKTIYLSVHMRSSFNKMRKNLEINWLDKLERLQPANFQISSVKSWQEIYHLIILPSYKEGTAVIGQTMESLARANYPKSKMIVVLAQEERAGIMAETVREFIEKEFGNKFYKLLITKHPADFPNELAGKGANASYAARSAMEKVIDPLSLDYEKVLVSNFDVDTNVPENYFSVLTYNFLTSRDPLKAAYQPIPIYTNNIWEAPAFARVFSFSTTFWQMIQQSRSEQLVTFSSQSMSFKALVEVDFWQTNVVSEDSRIFWQCLLRYDGNWRTVPIYYPVYMDANVAPTFFQTIKNQYKQIRRWHFGVENNPYFMFGFLKNKKIPFKKKLYFTYILNEKTNSAATNPLIIFLLGWLPIFVGGAEFNRSVLSFNLPQITHYIMIAAMLGLVSSAILSVILLPPKPPQYGRFKWVWMVLQWLLFPVNFIFFGAIPAIDAQTSLMFKKYLGFWPTPKTRIMNKG